MGRKRASLAAGLTPESVESKKKKKSKKKKRRESDSGGTAADERHGNSSRGDGHAAKRTSHSSRTREVELRCAPEGTVSPIVVSFANQTVPGDMGTLRFAVHGADDEGREGQRVVMGEGPRYVSGPVLARGFYDVYSLMHSALPSYVSFVASAALRGALYAYRACPKALLERRGTY